MNFISYFKLAFKDILEPKIIFISIIPILIALFSFGFSFYILISRFYDIFLGFFPHSFVLFSQESGFLSFIVAFIIKSIALVSIFICSSMIAFTLLNITISFYSPFFLNEIHKRHYRHVVINAPILETSIFSIKLFFKSLLTFLLISLIGLLFSFIGLAFISLIISFFAYFKFFRVNFNYGVCLSVLNVEDSKKFLLDNKVPIYFISLINYILIFVPIISIFIIPFQVLLLGHFILSNLSFLQAQRKYEDAELVHEG